MRDGTQGATPRIDAVLMHVIGPRVLDIGCAGQQGRRSDLTSPNWLHGRLLAQHSETVGLEYDPENVAALRDAGIPNVFLGDAQSFDLARSFDTIVAGELIEHLPNPGSFLSSCLRHLQPDGKIILTTPYAFSFLYVMYAWLQYPKTCSNDEHTMWFCPTTLKQLAAAAGLELETLQLVGDYRRDLSSKLGRASSRTAGFLQHVLPSRMISNSMVAVLRRPSL